MQTLQRVANTGLLASTIWAAPWLSLLCAGECCCLIVMQSPSGAAFAGPMHQLAATMSGVTRKDAICCIRFIVSIFHHSRLVFLKGRVVLPPSGFEDASGTASILADSLCNAACHSNSLSGHFHSALKLLPAKTWCGAFPFLLWFQYLATCGTVARLLCKQTSLFWQYGHLVPFDLL